jgi:hypothetical protein
MTKFWEKVNYILIVVIMLILTIRKGVTLIPFPHKKISYFFQQNITSVKF